ncbi:tricorn interacting prolyl aminopeptidase [Candidatus Mancarchaeum acidiphilum]|uniref:Tricorn interacting prolyl aminopeptidase n=1 Tax=Candidatus Mancarchaeum acidiphilum TaxID=1920749 RepID=A0A218NN46_9ARCH|nr:alpha/beta hydrolase [Candidatus Mancarchaeum acidiphilum]ASI13896.1 tricorn interacting prolyl aminopeptidase [Candidatus Mancarchaeum acidiphilum]
MKETIDRMEADTSFGKIFYLHRNGDLPLLFIHGLGAISNNWLPLFDKLDDRFELIALDLLGHGRSAKPNIEYTLDVQCKAIDELLGGIGINDPFAIIGNSYGGEIAASYSINHMAPKYLVLVDSSLAGINSMDSSDIDAFLKKLDAIEPGNDLGIMRNIIMNSEESGVHLDDLKNIDSKTLIIWGSDDPEIDVKYAGMIKNSIEGSSLYLIDKGGHAPMISKPDEVSDIINKNLI